MDVGFKSIAIERLSLNRTGIYVLVGLAVVFFLFPLYYLFLTSIKPFELLIASPPRFLFLPTLKPYVNLLFKEEYYQFYWNSVVVAGFSTSLAMVLAVPAAYGFVRYKFLGSKLIFFIILITRAYMPITTIIPLYLGGRYLGLLDTRILLILAYTAFQLPLALYVLRNFFSLIPTELQESAELDGCTPLGSLFKVILPLSGPGLLATFILTFVFNWNEFLFALVATSMNSRTAPVVLTAFLESESSLHWSELSCLGFLMTFPVLIFMIFLNEYLIKGLLSGAMKG